MPIGMCSVREVACVEMRFVIEAAPAASPASSQPAPSPARAAVQPAPETVSEAVKTPAMPRLPEPPRKQAAPRQKAQPLPEPLHEPRAEPVPAIEDARPADVSLPAEASPVEASAADGSGKAFEAPSEGGESIQQAVVTKGRGAGHAAGATVFGGSGGPGFIRRVLPRYPRLAREMGREGSVVLSLTIDENGFLQDVAVVESAGFGFDEEAMRAMRASSFRAAVRNGKTVASRALLPVRFMLRGSGDD
jgi:protein TonB